MSPSRSTAEQLQAMHQQGFVLLRQVLQPPQVEAVRTAIDRLETEKKKIGKKKK